MRLEQRLTRLEARVPRPADPYDWRAIAAKLGSKDLAALEYAHDVILRRSPDADAELPDGETMATMQAEVWRLYRYWRPLEDEAEAVYGRHRSHRTFDELEARATVLARYGLARTAENAVPADAIGEVEQEWLRRMRARAASVGVSETDQPLGPAVAGGSQ